MEHRISASEKMCYSLAGFGQSMIYALSSTFLLPFFTDVLGIGAGIAGTIFLIARLWDAVNDPIMGTIVDKTNTRFGKMRPYILFTAFPILVLTVLCFVVPDLDTAGKTAYATVIYILWGMVYTISDIPYNGLSSALSSSTEQRTKLLSMSKLFVALGTGVPVLLVPLLVPLFENQGTGYLCVAVIFSFVGMAMFTLAFFGTKERVHYAGKRNSLRDILKAIVKNRPLLLLVLSGVLNSLRFLPQSAGMYFAQYNLGSKQYFTLLGGIIIASSAVAIILVPILLKRMTKRDLYVYSSIFGSVMSFIMFFVGYESLATVCVLLFFACLPIGMFTILLPAMIADSVDYAEWKTGKRIEGVCFAGNSFVFKLTAGIAAFVTGIVLSAVGFVDNQPEQTERVKDGIYILVTVLPAVGGMLCCLPMLFYKFTEDEQHRAIEEISAREAGEGNPPQSPDGETERERSGDGESQDPPSNEIQRKGGG